MRSEDYKAGFKCARDCIIAEIIGLQNSDPKGFSSRECQAYQKLLNIIIDKYGRIYEYFVEPEPECEEEEEEL